MPAPRGRDLEFTRKRLTDWLATKLSQATELRVSELSGPDMTGFSSDTLMFDVTWKQDGVGKSEALVARIKPTGFPVFPEYDMGRQFHLQRALEETDVPVPHMFWLEEDEGVLGAPFYVMRKIEGRIPTDNPPYHTGGWMTEIQPEERASIWWSGLEILSRIHRLDWQALALGFLEQPEPGATLIDRHLEYYAHFLAWSMEGSPHPVCEAAFDWLKKNRPSGEPVTLCWGDARIGNMIFHDNQCVAVLDWEMARLGSPEEDLAWWLYLDRHHSEGVGVARLPGFPGRDETVACYRELTGHVPVHLDYYEIFAGFRFSVIMARIGRQMKAYEMLPPESDFDVSNPCSQLLARLMER